MTARQYKCVLGCPNKYIIFFYIWNGRGKHFVCATKNSAVEAGFVPKTFWLVVRRSTDHGMRVLPVNEATQFEQITYNNYSQALVAIIQECDKQNCDYAMTPSHNR